MVEVRVQEIVGMWVGGLNFGKFAVDKFTFISCLF